MSDIYFERQHGLDFESARAKAQAWLQEAKNQFGLNINYIKGNNQDNASIHKAGVEGQATLTADKIIFQAKLGLFAKPLKGMISSGIKEGLDNYFPQS